MTTWRSYITTAPKTEPPPARPSAQRHGRRLRIGTRLRRREPSMSGYLYISPALILYAAFVLVPLGYAVYLSFFDWGGAGPKTFVGWANYAALAQDPQLAASFTHAAILMIFYAVVPIIFALFLTAFMARVSISGIGVYRTILFLPQVISLVAIAVAWEWILAPDGPLDSALRAIGAGALAQPWLGSFTWALPAVGIIGSWIGYGFAMVLFMSGVGKIPQSLYDAARVDGAGAVREFFAITLPGLRREIVVALVMTITSALTTFDIVYVMTAGGPGTSTTLPAYTVFNLAFTQFEVGKAAAAGVVLALLVFIVAVVILRIGRTEENGNG